MIDSPRPSGRPGRTSARRLRFVVALATFGAAVAACAPAAPDPVDEDAPQSVDRSASSSRDPYRRRWERHRPPRAPEPPTTQPPQAPPSGPPSTMPPTTPPTTPPSPPPVGVPGGPKGVAGSFRLLFSDEFEGSTLGPAWYANRWFATECAPGAGRPEEQFYTSRPQNVSVHGGALHLTAIRETYSCREWGGTKQFTSGWVQTGGSRDVGGRNVPPGFTCTVGCFVEASVRMPPGGLTFPAVWMLPVRRSASGADAQYPSRPEIDIAEFWDTWSSWEHHIHSACGGRSVDVGSTHVGPDASAGYRTIGVWWRSPNHLEWYVDGVLSWTYTGCGVPGAGEEMYIILNHAVGHAAPSPSRGEPFPKDMAVDYVRAWAG